MADPSESDGLTGSPSVQTTRARGLARRLPALLAIAVFALIVLMGISRDREVLDATARYDDVDIEPNELVEHVEGNVDEFMKIANEERKYNQRQRAIEREEKADEKRRKREENRKRDPNLPAPKPTPKPTPMENPAVESAWEFLYKNTGGALIMHTDSEWQEDDLESDKLNVIAFTVQIFSRTNRNAVAIGNAAMWFFKIARAWPRDVVLTSEAIDTVEGLLKVDIDKFVNKTGDEVQELVNYVPAQPTAETEEEAEEEGDAGPSGKLVFNMTGFHSLAKAKKSGALDKNELQTLHANHVEAVVSDLLDSGAISGGKSVVRLQTAVEAHESLDEWRKLLVFTLGVAESRTVFADFMREWKNGKGFKPQKLKRAKGEALVQVLTNAADLLKIVEEGCEKYPRVNTMLRAALFKFLDNAPDNDDAENIDLPEEAQAGVPDNDADVDEDDDDDN